MNPERHRQAMQILADALDCDTGAREQWLAHACAGDEQLRTDIQALIEQRKQARGFLEESLFEMAENQLESEQWLIGKQVGVYRITGIIGRGGMGAVYRAVRDDDEFHREVAIKIIRPGLDSLLILRRFRNERQILANLDHPNIARLFDGGTTEQGVPYLVMEYVEGHLIHDFANAEQLSIADRLKLFLKVCDAVEYAHRHHVIHRDLKPGNILVTKQGNPKLLDFGVAKVLDPGPLVITQDSTIALLRGITPQYASPEQLRGESVTAASDIYSLGVILCELLTGEKPYNLRGASPYEFMQVVCESEPNKPSEIVKTKTESPGSSSNRIGIPEPASVRRRLTGDLDTIVLKALRKEPERRYASVADFAEDIRRHIEKLPIKARKDTVAYRTIKFIRRNRVATLTTTVVAIICLLIGILLTLLSIQPARKSVAVLPFVNATRDQNLDYLSDGLTENLIGQLSKIPNLRVPTSSSVFHYKGKTQDPLSIGRDLNVETVLTGRVSSTGDQLVIDISLIDVASGEVFENHKYSRAPTELLATQSQIGRDVAGMLVGSFSVEQRRFNENLPRDNETYRFFLQGNYFRNLRTFDGLSRAIPHYQNAIAKDPTYSLAYDGLAKSYALLGAFMHYRAKDAFPPAKDACLKALELDPNLAEAHTTLALILWLYDWEWEAADREFRRAIELNPQYTTAHHWYGLYLGEMGRADESIAEMKRAMELDPVSLAIVADLGRVYFFARRYDEALQQYKHAFEMQPNPYGALHAEVGYVYEAKGMIPEWFQTINPGEINDKNRKAYQTRNFKEFIRYMAQHGSYYDRAECYARLGEKTRAFEQLEVVYKERDHRMSQLKVNPVWDPLRSDPRFDDWLRRMNLKS